MHLYGAAGANDANVHVVSYVVRQCLLFAYVGRERSNVLHQVVVQVMSSEDCRALGAPYPSLLNDNTLCVYYTNASQNVCSMMSGGSLVCRQGNNWWQYGFVTMGMGCVNATQPEIHSSVVKYLPWIKQNTIGRCLHFIACSRYGAHGQLLEMTQYYFC